MPVEADCPGEPPSLLDSIPVFAVGDSYYTIRVGQRVRVIALKVNDELLTFLEKAPADTYDHFQAQAQQILDTLVFP